MKHVLFIPAFFALLLLSCSEEYDNKNEEPRISLDQKVKNVTELYLDLNSLTKSSNSLVNTLFSSVVWQSLPNELVKQIQMEKPILITEYFDSNVNTIGIALKTRKIYSYLTFFHLNGEFIPTIVSSEHKGKFFYVAISDLNSTPYFSFYVNEQYKLGNFLVNQDMPTFQNNGTSKSTLKDQTCMEKTDKFGDCMLCAIRECYDDWVCAVVCSIYASYCAAGFAIGCAID